MLAIDPERFDELVGEAIDSLPDEFAVALNNVGIVVEDEGDGTLFGLYHGIPLTQRSPHTYHGVMPDKITIFRGPIVRACRNETDVARLVRRTVMHEIAHHFGISDARLRELGAY